MAPYVVMHDVLQGIRNRDLQPALEWIAKHKGELSETGNPTDFHFQLHRLQFLHLLEAEGRLSPACFVVWVLGAQGHIFFG